MGRGRDALAEANQWLNNTARPQDVRPITNALRQGVDDNSPGCGSPEPSGAKGELLELGELHCFSKEMGLLRST